MLCWLRVSLLSIMDVEVLKAVDYHHWLVAESGFLVVLLLVLNCFLFVTGKRRWMSEHQCVKCGTVFWLAVLESCLGASLRGEDEVSKIHIKIEMISWSVIANQVNG